MDNWISTAFELFKRGNSDADIFHQLLAAGCARSLAGRLLCFIPLSCGRMVLADLGIEFPEKYVCFQADGALGPARSLGSDRDWVAIDSFLTARKATETPAISIIGMRSAEFDAINKALLNGSKPENLVLSAPVFTFEDSENVTSASTTTKAKPWWAFWR
jgi:hypothetical protein